MGLSSLLSVGKCGGFAALSLNPNRNLTLNLSLAPSAERGAVSSGGRD